MVGEIEVLGSEPRRQVPDPKVAAMPANYRISFEPSAVKVKVRFNGTLVAESRRALVMRETRYAPIYYIPRDDIRMDLLQRSDHWTHCPFKGNASYWSLKVDGQSAENVAWSYEDPLPEAASIRGYMAFYNNQVEASYDDGRAFDIQTADGPGGYTNRFADWMLREAWDATTTEELVERLSRYLVERGVPLWRLALMVRTLHPQLAGKSYLWTGSDEPLEMHTIPYSSLESAAYLDSPMKPIFEGSGGIRRQLDMESPELDFPILTELRDQGATDYVAMPLMFSDGQINAVTLTSNKPGGFSTDDLGQIYEIMPLLSRLIEVHALRHTARTLLDTYLGAYTGEQVLTGRIKRGDGENVPAVIWMCDLRRSTERAEKLSREDYLQLLNDFFDCTAGAVLEQGGEVLKFIGDGVLAIFPIAQSESVAAGELCSKPSPEASAALAQALAAVREACFRVEQLNAARVEDGQDELDFVVAVHKGEVAYGNVGVPGRLDFTVTGTATNEVARLALLAKSLEQRVILSECVALSTEESVVPLGAHSLRGVPGESKVFTFDTTRGAGAQPDRV